MKECHCKILCHIAVVVIALNIQINIFSSAKCGITSVAHNSRDAHFKKFILYCQANVYEITITVNDSLVLHHKAHKNFRYHSITDQTKRKKY